MVFLLTTFVTTDNFVHLRYLQNKYTPSSDVIFFRKKSLSRIPCFPQQITLLFSLYYTPTYMYQKLVAHSITCVQLTWSHIHSLSPLVMFVGGISVLLACLIVIRLTLKVFVSPGLNSDCTVLIILFVL